MITITRILHLLTIHIVLHHVFKSTATVKVNSFTDIWSHILEEKLPQPLEISWIFYGRLYVVVQLYSVFLKCLGKI